MEFNPEQIFLPETIEKWKRDGVNEEELDVMIATIAVVNAESPMHIIKGPTCTAIVMIQIGVDICRQMLLAGLDINCLRNFNERIAKKVSQHESE